MNINTRECLRHVRMKSVDEIHERRVAVDENLENTLALLYFMRAPAVVSADAPNRSYL
jgi:hypothetical protein